MNTQKIIFLLIGTAYQDTALDGENSLNVYLSSKATHQEQFFSQLNQLGYTITIHSG